MRLNRRKYLFYAGQGKAWLELFYIAAESYGVDLNEYPTRRWQEPFRDLTPKESELHAKVFMEFFR